MLYFKSLGELAQLARAPALHAGGQGFESLILHQISKKRGTFDFASECLLYCVDLTLYLSR